MGCAEIQDSWATKIALTDAAGDSGAARVSGVGFMHNKV